MYICSGFNSHHVIGTCHSFLLCGCIYSRLSPSFKNTKTQTHTYIHRHHCIVRMYNVFFYIKIVSPKLPTVYQTLQFTKRYSLPNATVYLTLQFTKRYSLPNATVYQTLRFTKRYSLPNVTVYQTLQFT